MVKTTQSEIETIALGAQIGKGLKGGEVILLAGELGTGKTAFTKGVAKSLGVTNRVASPTFVLMKNYLGERGLILVHVDGYRLDSPLEGKSIGLDEFLNQPNSVCVIEWPQNILLPQGISKIIRVTLEHIDHEKRRITY